MKAKRQVWVVEMLRPRSAEWEPTCGVFLRRRDANADRMVWANNNRKHYFRVTKYVAGEQP